MEISEQFLCLFSGQIEERDGSYVVEVPKQELRLGDLEEDETYRVAMLSSSTSTETAQEPDHKSGTESTQESTHEQEDEGDYGPLEPPVEEGETRTVEIENVGDQGDGITRVERGYVVIVPGTDKGERVRIEITQVRENVAFADVVEHIDYYT